MKESRRRQDGGGPVRAESPRVAALHGELERSLIGAHRDLQQMLKRAAGGPLRAELTRVDQSVERCLMLLRELPGAKVEGPAPEHRAEAPAAETSRGPKVRVLLVDDHELVREGLVGLLGEEPDIEVVGEASGGFVALEMVRALRPDVVVMDVSMPDMNGIEATRRITMELPGVRVIGLSMHQEEDMAAAMREFGAAAYLTKDGSSEALLDAIRDRTGTH